MKNKSMGIALMGEDVLKGSFPAFINEKATSLLLDISDTEVEHDLERLIGACCHLRHLHIATTQVFHIPRPLEELSYIYMESPTQELTALIRLVPNVRQIGWLPRTSKPLAEKSGALGPLALHTLHVYLWSNTSVLLAPLLTNRWSVRTLILSIDSATLRTLRRCGVGPGDLPLTRELKFIIAYGCEGEMAPLRALMKACHLRSLAVQACVEKTIRLLSSALGACGALSALSLMCEDYEDYGDHVLCAPWNSRYCRRTRTCSTLCALVVDLDASC